MYVKDNIGNWLEKLIANNEFGHEDFSIIQTVLKKGYGLFHVEYGTDDRGVPYAEIGVASTRPFEIVSLKLSTPDEVWQDTQCDSDSAEILGVDIEDACAYCNNHLFPIVHIDITMPGELSRKFVFGYTESGSNDEDDYDLDIEVNDCTNDLSDLYELIFRCSFDPVRFGELNMAQTVPNMVMCRDYTILYLLEWFIRNTPTMLPEDTKSGE